jgi:hypothetical protein
MKMQRFIFDHDSTVDLQAVDAIQRVGSPDHHGIRVVLRGGQVIAMRLHYHATVALWQAFNGVTNVAPSIPDPPSQFAAQ